PPNRTRQKMIGSPPTGRDIASNGVPKGDPDEFLFSAGEHPLGAVRLHVVPMQIVVPAAIHGLGRFFIRYKKGETPVRMREEIIVEGQKFSAESGLVGVDVTFLANHLLAHPRERTFELTSTEQGAAWRLMGAGKETEWSGHYYRERAYSFLVTLWPDSAEG